MVTHTSDRFDDFEKYALGMIKKGEAYMDDTPQVRESSTMVPPDCLFDLPSDVSPHWLLLLHASCSHDTISWSYVAHLGLSVFGTAAGFVLEC